MRRKTCILIILAMVLTLSGCGWWKDLRTRNKPVRNVPEVLYQSGVEAYQEGRYTRAIEHFTRVKEQHPLHPLALMAELGIADAHFSDANYGEADLAYTDFLNLHPTHESIPYVMYQIGICHYNQIQTIDRDQTETVRTAKDFERLIAKFPKSKFALMAEKKLQECRQRMAEHEFYIGEFYFKRGNYEAALKRFQFLAKNYPAVGLDYKTGIYLAETKKRAEEEKAMLAKGGTKKKDLTAEYRAIGIW
jgi:outer membrane protein assembly factor BamD